MFFIGVMNELLKLFCVSSNIYTLQTRPHVNRFFTKNICLHGFIIILQYTFVILKKNSFIQSILLRKTPSYYLGRIDFNDLTRCKNVYFPGKFKIYSFLVRSLFVKGNVQLVVVVAVLYC